MSHILFYTDTPNVGGAEKQMLLLLHYLKALGIKVSLAYGKYSRLNTMRANFEEVCERIYVVNAAHKHDPRHYFGLEKIIRSQAKKGDAFDAIHLQLWNPGACRYAFLAASNTKTPIITTEHDPFPLGGIKKLLKRRALKKTAHTIVISSQNARMMVEEYGLLPEKLSTIHNGIELEHFTGNIAKATLPTKKGDTVIVCIAELHPRKGHKYLLEAFGRLSATIPGLSLLLVGDGSARKELQKSAPQGVHFLGWRNDIPQVLRASDVFVLPSLKEAFGMVVLEAMAVGIPVIATASGGVPDIIEDGKTGLLVPPADSSALSDAILNILHNAAQAKDMTKAASESIKAHFSAERMAKQTLAVYQKVLI